MISPEAVGSNYEKRSQRIYKHGKIMDFYDLLGKCSDKIIMNKLFQKPRTAGNPDSWEILRAQPEEMPMSFIKSFSIIQRTDRIPMQRNSLKVFFRYLLGNAFLTISQAAYVKKSRLIFFNNNAVLFNLQITLFVLLFGISLRAGFRRFLRPRWLTAGLLAAALDRCVPLLFPYAWGNFIAGNGWLVQMADITGVFGLTFIQFAAAYFCYRILRVIVIAFARGSGLSGMRVLARPVAARLAWPVPILLVLCAGYGGIRRAQVEDMQRSLPVVRVAIINPNAPPEDEAFVNARVLEKLMCDTIPGLADRACAAVRGGIDLVVLPESAVPFMCALDTPESRRRRRYLPAAELMAQRIGYNLDADVFMNETAYAGAPGAKPGGRASIYNSSVLYSRDGRRRDSYHKRRLLPFGEYLPGARLLESLGLAKLARELMGGSRFSPGPRSNLIPYSAGHDGSGARVAEPQNCTTLRGTSPRNFEKIFPPGRAFEPRGYFIPLICYEVLFPDLVRSFFRDAGGRNPDFIVNITQDGWYGNTRETYQHFELGRIRAVETRRALVRSVNNGAAGFVDIAGNYVRPLAGPERTVPETENFQVWDVPVNRSGETVYVRCGDAWVFALLLLYAAAAAVRAYRERIDSRGPAGGSGRGE